MRKNNNNLFFIAPLLFAMVLFAFLIHKVNAGTVAHTYDSLNRLTKTIYTNGSQTVTTDYVYDKAGNMTQFTRVVEGSADSDADGIPDSDDNCPNKPNGPNLGTCSSTSDKPNINCTSDANCANGCSSNGLCIKDQRDTDGDNIGDVCDYCDGNGANDTDNDGYCDLEDNCPTNCNSLQLDADKDGIGDVCDPDPGCGGCSGVECEQECV